MTRTTAARLSFACLLLACVPHLSAQDLPTYTGSVRGSNVRHDGGQRPAVGVQNFQVIRSVIAPGGAADGDNSRYRHHVDIAHWADQLWVSHIGEYGVNLSRSTDGIQWTHSQLFPRGITIAGNATRNHHRMSFYVSPTTGKLLASTFYGKDTGTNGGGSNGFVRVVREVAPDGSLGPVYSVRYNTGTSPSSVPWAHFNTSSNTAFKTAVNDLLNDPLYRQQWYEEDRNNADGFYTVTQSGDFAAKAFSWYSLNDGRVVGTWKGAAHAITHAGGSWTPGNVSTPQVEQVAYDANDNQLSFNRLGMGPHSKMFGQRTSDGRFAFVGNTPGQQWKRWPLSITTSADGLIFDANYLSVHGEVPIERYSNYWPVDHKDAGPQYVRGITPGNGVHPDGHMWIAYSSNKEDIFVSRIPVPVRSAVSGPVFDHFQQLSPGGFVNDWNVYSPQWAPVRVREDAGGNRYVRLSDEDPHDYAKLVRVFEQSTAGNLRFSLRPQQSNTGQLDIELTDAAGKRPVRLRLNGSGSVLVFRNGSFQSLASYAANVWTDVQLSFDIVTGRFSIRFGSTVLNDIAFAESVASLERLELRTGDFRMTDTTRRPYIQVPEGYPTTHLSDADVRRPLASFDLDNVIIVPEPVATLLAAAPAVLLRRTRRRH